MKSKKSNEGNKASEADTQIGLAESALNKAVLRLKGLEHLTEQRNKLIEIREMLHNIEVV